MRPPLPHHPPKKADILLGVAIGWLIASPLIAILLLALVLDI